MLHTVPKGLHVRMGGFVEWVLSRDYPSETWSHISLHASYSSLKYLTFEFHIELKGPLCILGGAFALRGRERSPSNIKILYSLLLLPWTKDGSAACTVVPEFLFQFKVGHAAEFILLLMLFVAKVSDFFKVIVVNIQGVPCWFGYNWRLGLGR